MAKTDKDVFTTWLRDAHAFEMKLVQELKAHVAQAKDHPAVQQKLERHISETRNHAKVVEGILKELGADTSTVKSALGQAAGAAMGISTAMLGDSDVKNTLAEYTWEHTEIASYTSLITAAEHLHLPEAVEKLRGILREEEEMAGWLHHQIEAVTIECLREQAEPVPA